MKKVFLSLFFLFLANLLKAQSYYQVTTRTLNVRSAANKDAEIVGKFYLGDSVYVIDYSNGWSQVELRDGKYGYVSSKYISNDFKTYSESTNESKKKKRMPNWQAILILLIIAAVIYKGAKKSFSGGSSSNTPKPKPVYWYHCKNCNEKIQSTKSPTSVNCSQATFHHWTNLGEVGDKNYNCKNCGTTVWTKRNPPSTNCSRSTFHHWTAL